MTLNHCQTLVVALLLLAPAARLLGEESQPVAPDPPETGVASAAGNAANIQQSQGQEPLYQVSNSVEEFAARFGYWGVLTSGSQVKTGEWQGLQDSSPFWDADGLLSDGDRTFNFHATGVESEATQAGLRYYRGPGLTVDTNYNRYIHRLDHKPPTGFNDGPFGTLAPPFPAPLPNANPGNVAQFAQDLNMGQDYAIRVQELKAGFKGNLTDNIRWRLNVWGLKKEGERQATEIGHCYTLNSSTTLAEGVNQVAGQPGGARCHWLSQEQRIDWLTAEIEPVIEARLTDWLTFEYSRPMRKFGQDDEMVYRTHNGGGALPGVGANTLSPYAVVPETTTEIDRMKLGAQLGEYTDAYVLGYVGNNHNNFRDTNRHFSGVDGRVSNRAIDGLQLTGYARTYQTNSTTPGQTLNQQFNSTVWGEPTFASIDEQISRQFNAYGATSRWRPFWDERGTLRGGLSLIGGYEFSQIIRQNTEHDLSVLNPNAVPPITADSMIDIEHTQPDSNTHKFFAGTIHDWTRAFRTNWKYTFIDTHVPLFGITTGEKNPAAEDFAAPGVGVHNSSVPTHVDRFEIGATWQPIDTFLLNGTVYLEQSTHRDDFARFNQDSYPWVVSAWYAPTCKLSLNGGYAQFSSFIDQDITLGSQGRYGSFPGPHASEWEETPSFTAPWRFMGRSDVVNLGGVYAWTERLSLNGGLEYVRGLNRVATPPSPTNDAYPDGRGSFTPTPYTEIAQASRVEVNTYRLSAGVDYWLRDGITVYFRYNFYDYLDETAAFNTGEAHMFLGGLTAMF